MLSPGQRSWAAPSASAAPSKASRRLFCSCCPNSPDTGGRETSMRSTSFLCRAFEISILILSPSFGTCLSPADPRTLRSDAALPQVVRQRDPDEFRHRYPVSGGPLLDLF